MKAYWEEAVVTEQYRDETAQIANANGSGAETVRRFSDDPMYKGLYVVVTYADFVRAIFESHKHVKRNGTLTR